MRPGGRRRMCLQREGSCGYARGRQGCPHIPDNLQAGRLVKGLLAAPHGQFAPCARWCFVDLAMNTVACLPPPCLPHCLLPQGPPGGVPEERVWVQGAGRRAPRAGGGALQASTNYMPGASQGPAAGGWLSSCVRAALAARLLRRPCRPCSPLGRRFSPAPHPCLHLPRATL